MFIVVNYFIFVPIFSVSLIINKFSRLPIISVRVLPLFTYPLSYPYINFYPHLFGPFSSYSQTLNNSTFNIQYKIRCFTRLSLFFVVSDSFRTLHCWSIHLQNFLFLCIYLKIYPFSVIGHTIKVQNGYSICNNDCLIKSDVGLRIVVQGTATALHSKWFLYFLSHKASPGLQKNKLLSKLYFCFNGQRN
jgi:hypothetical protein